VCVWQFAFVLQTHTHTHNGMENGAFPLANFLQLALLQLFLGHVIVLTSGEGNKK